jgi:hypothetical protein
VVHVLAQLTFPGLAAFVDREESAMIKPATGSSQGAPVIA